MKVFISAEDYNCDALFQPQFDRAKAFVVFATETEEWDAYANPAIHAKGNINLDVKAAWFVADRGCHVVISDNFGEYSPTMLTGINIQLFRPPPGELVTVRKLVALYLKGQLIAVKAPPRSEDDTMRIFPDNS